VSETNDDGEESVASDEVSETMYDGVRDDDPEEYRPTMD